MSMLFKLLRHCDRNPGDLKAAYCAEGWSRHVTLLQMVIRRVTEHRRLSLNGKVIPKSDGVIKHPRSPGGY